MREVSYETQKALEKTLKPCPHCGGKAELRNGNPEPMEMLPPLPTVEAYCIECGASSGLIAWELPKFDLEHEIDAAMAAVEVWNQRTGEEARG